MELRVDMRKLLLAALVLILLPSIANAQTTVGFQPPSLSLPIIIGLALIDSINPCVIGVLILLITVLIKSGDKRNILIKGAAYTTGVYLTYLIGGITLLGLFNVVRSITAVSQAFYIVIGTFVILAGFLEVKDYFWYGRWYSLAIPHRFIDLAEKQASRSAAGLAPAFLAGVILTLIELPCTGAPYLAVLTLMSQSGYGYVTALPLLLLYNLVFVLPLALIVALAYNGVDMKRLEGARKEHRGRMRLAVGAVLLTIGIWIITAVAESLLWPLISLSIGVPLLMAVLKNVFKV